MYSDNYVRTVRHLSASIAADHDDPTLFGYTHPIDPGVVARAFIGHDVPTSVTDAEGRNDYGGEHGWRASITKEIKRVEGFGAWQLVSADELRAARRAHPDRVSVGHIVVAFRVKADADGVLKGAGITKKSRIAFADEIGQSTAFIDTYSGCADDITDRTITSIGHRMGAQQDTCDVGGAYFHGTPTPPDQGGRAVFAEIPKYMHHYGDYPTHDMAGRKNYLRITGNMPGRKDAGAIWARRYDGFLKRIGMRQGVVDRRLFVLSTDQGTLFAHIHVDDTRLTFDNPELRQWFMTNWATEFGEAPMKTILDEDFVGVRRTVTDPHTVEYSCRGVIKSMSELIKPYPLAPGVTDAWPMSPNATRELRAGPSEKNPLVPLLIPIARQICGTIGFIVTHVRPDAYFAFCVLAKYMGDKLTKRAFAHLLKLAWYLVRTHDIPLVLYPPPSEGVVWGRAGVCSAWVDSSHGNSDEGLSYGGFVVMNNEGGALAWKCKAHEIATDSPGAQELVMATSCYKYILALRMLLLDLRLHADPMGPTPLYTDSQILLDGSQCEKLAKSSRWLATRYAMIRHGRACGLIDSIKVKSEDNVADIVTKPLTGETFIRHRATILGLSRWRSGQGARREDLPSVP